MIERFTVEEINLICVFNRQSRDELISELISAITDFDTGNEQSDSEMFEIAQRALDKVSKMSGADFAALEFYPEYGDGEQEGENV
jgi:hypothetical protein